MAIQSEGKATVLDVLVPVVIARGEEMACGAYVFNVTPSPLFALSTGHQAIRPPVLHYTALVKSCTFLKDKMRSTTRCVKHME